VLSFWAAAKPGMAVASATMKQRGIKMQGV
jgi:hypothetical protein